MSIFTDKRNRKGNGEDTPADIWAIRIHNNTHVFNNYIVNRYNRLMKWVWDNPDHSPEEIFASLGDKAEGLVKACALLEAMIDFTAPHRLYKKPDVELKIKINGEVEIIR